MRIPLKYLLPLLIFVTGLILVTFQTYAHMTDEYSTMFKKSFIQAKIVGNRLSSRITAEAQNGQIVHERISSISASYMADMLDQIDIYDQDFKPLFSRYITSHPNDKKEPFEQSIAEKVAQDQFSALKYLKDARHIDGYFPIDLPAQKGRVLSRNTGVMHLVFDINAEYEEATQNIIKNAVMNVSTVAIMVLTFSLLMYFFVFKRLNVLHKATKQLAQGNFDVHVETKGNDELTEVIHTFNTMALQMDAYKHTMEERVELALKERTEQSKLLIQQSRLASMGEMIGNIAHQWRQPLNTVGLIIQKLQAFSERGKLTEEKLEENVEKATLIINNMSKTIDDFRNFFKPDKQKEHFLIKELLHDVLSLVEAGFNDNSIDIDIDISQPNTLIYGFRNEFSQVIINLLNNSKDALIENRLRERKIWVSAKQENAQVIFKISDNAGGIPPQVIDRVFEPYFTTKEEGKGTGIGLYMSKMIIEENMQGRIQVNNNEHGAEFSMIFKNEKGQD